jgi:SAM-dependent methyltransferase
MVLPGARVGGIPPLVRRVPKKVFADAMVTGADGQREARGDSLKKRLVSFWNSREVYWDPISTSEATESPQRAKAISFLPEGGKVLDVACGSATNASLVRRRCSYVGADISPTGLRRVSGSALRLVCADAEQLPFARESFDATISTFALEHCVNPVQMLQEMHRVVRPGGRIVLLGPSWDLPFWYPNAMQSSLQDRGRRMAYTWRRLLGQMGGWLLGRLPFFCVEEPDVFHWELVNDADAVYVVWTYEVIRQMKRFGCRVIHAEADDRMWGTNSFVRLLKRMLYLLPPYRHAGSTVLVVFER